MSDLIERLRRYEKIFNDCQIEAPYLGQAADEIERLTLELKETIDVEVTLHDEIERLTARVAELEAALASKEKP